MYINALIVVYAMKVVRKEMVMDAAQDIEHPFITKLNVSFCDDKRYYLIYDYIPGGSLAQYIAEQVIYISL